jgi:hypothetical protein
MTTLNCKQGDVAICIYSELDNLGKIMTCLQLLPPSTKFLCKDVTGKLVEAVTNEDTYHWVVDCIISTELKDMGGVFKTNVMRDSYLKPIPPLNLLDCMEDEMLKLVLVNDKRKALVL